MRILVFLVLMTAFPLHATERPEQFAAGAPIRVEGKAAIYGVTLPVEVYSGAARADLGDLRVFNAAGEPVPFAFVPRPADPVARPSTAALALFPLRAPAGTGVDGLDVRVHRAADGTIVNISAREAAPGDRDRLVGYLLDASSFKEPLHALELALAGSEDFVARIKVEASDDFAAWRTLAADAPVVRLSADGHRLTATRVRLQPQRAKYLRLSWPAKGPAVELTGVRAESQETTVEPMRVWVAASGVPAKDRANSIACRNNLRQCGVANMLYVDDQEDRLPYAHLAGMSNPNSNNWMVLLTPYIKRTGFAAGSTTEDSDFAKSVYTCAVRMREPLNNPAIPPPPWGWSPWRVSFGMNSATAIGVNGTDITDHGSFAYAGAAKMTSVQRASETFLISDCSYDVGFVGMPWKENFFLRYSTFGGKPVYRAGFKHGKAQPEGRVNIVFMDSHVEDRSLKQTNSFVQKWY